MCVYITRLNEKGEGEKVMREEDKPDKNDMLQIGHISASTSCFLGIRSRPVSFFPKIEVSSVSKVLKTVV